MADKTQAFLSVYEWYSAFKRGRDVVEDLPRSGRPSTSSTEVNIVKVKEMLTETKPLNFLCLTNQFVPL